MVQEIPIYDITLDGDSLGLTAISLVDSPAIMENWVAFSKQQMIWMSNAEKREVIAPLLIPDQLILRRAEDGSLYYIRWRRETILQAAEMYIANGWFNNFTYMHPTFYNKDMKYEDALEKDIYMLRLWTIEDAANDDANTKYGFNLPEGTLMCHFKVHNRKLWQKIKNKEVMGCSIEAFTTMVKNNSNIKVNVNMDFSNKQMSLFQKFIAFMNEVSAEAKDIADVAKKDETDSGEVSLKYYLDDEHYMEVDAEGFVRDEEYNLVAEGEYKLADGNIIVVDANNKLVETKAESDVKEEEPVEAPLAEEKLKDEEKEKKDEEDAKEDEGKVDGESGATEPEGDAVGDEEGAEDADDEKKKVAGAELDDKEKKDEEIPVEAPVEEVPTEEQPTEEPPLTLVPFVIDGVEYQLPQEVVDYINALVGEKDNAMNEIALMKEQIPSATPIPTVINQSVESVEDSETDGLFSAIKALNRKR